MKRAVAVVLLIVFVLSAFSGIVSAQTENMTAIGLDSNLHNLKPEKQRGGFSSDEPILLDEVKETRGTKGTLRGADSEPEETIYDYLEDSMKNRVEKIQLYPTYKIPAPAGNIDEFHRIVRTVLFNNYDIFAYDDFTYRVITNNGNRYVYDFTPTYYTPDEETDELAREKMSDAIDEYLDAVSDIPQDDVVGKMLVIHDLLCANNMYDHEGLANEQDYHIPCDYARTAYNMFTKNKAVCQGYAIALKAIYDKLNEELMNETGANENIIETSFCSSNEMAHIWNVVKIDGQWYHLDATWDDVDYDEGGNPVETAWHGYFLQTDSEFADHLKYDEDSGEIIYDWVFYTDEQVVCDDDEYSQDYIFNIGYTYLISYSNGGYDIELVYALRSNSIVLTKILATDPYVEEGSNVNRVIFFTQQPFDDIMRISTAFDENGVLMENKCVIDKMEFASYDENGFRNFYLLPPYNNNIPTRLFIWAPYTGEPLCRAIDLPAVAQ